MSNRISKNDALPESEAKAAAIFIFTAVLTYAQPKGPDAVEKITKIYCEAREDANDQVLAMASVLVDGLRWGNWPWNV